MYTAPKDLQYILQSVQDIINTNIIKNVTLPDQLIPQYDIYVNRTEHPLIGKIVLAAREQLHATNLYHCDCTAGCTFLCGSSVKIAVSGFFSMA